MKNEMSTSLVNTTIQVLKLLKTENILMSHSLLEKQQEMLVLVARKKPHVELQSVKYYRIIVKEAIDISKSEHMSL